MSGLDAKYEGIRRVTIETSNSTELVLVRTKEDGLKVRVATVQLVVKWLRKVR